MFTVGHILPREGSLNNCQMTAINRILSLSTAVVLEIINKSLNLYIVQVCSLGWEDPLEEGMATHSSILAWRIPWTEEPSGLWSIGLQRVRHD